MGNKKQAFLNLWGMPIGMAATTMIGLILAIISTEWHLFSWIALTLPIVVMIKYGRKFFTKSR